MHLRSFLAPPATVQGVFSIVMTLFSMDSFGPLPLGWIPYERFLIFLLIAVWKKSIPLPFSSPM